MTVDDAIDIFFFFLRKKMATLREGSSESLRLLHEYASLKRLIESHKRRIGDNSVANKSRVVVEGPRPNVGSFRSFQNNIYSLKRNINHKQKHTQSIPKAITTPIRKSAPKQPSKPTKSPKLNPFQPPKIVSKYKMTKCNNSTSQLALKPTLSTSVVNNATKSLYSWSASGSKGEDTNLGTIAPHPSFPTSSLPFRSSLSLVASKPRPSPKITVKVRCNRTPKSIRRVSKYSLKNTTATQKKLSLDWVKSQRQKPIVINKTYALRRHQSPPKSRNAVKSRFVVIGKLLYKSSKTKLLCTGSAKTKFTNRNAKIKKTNQAKSTKERIVTVRGVKFSMDSKGKTLRRIDPVANSKEGANGIVATLPKNRGLESSLVSRVDIGGETYIRTRPGVLIRSSGNQLRSLASRVVTKSIYRLTSAKQFKSQQFCLFFNKFGRCSKQLKGNCPYIHDVDKIAVCKRFLRGECRVEGCTFSHKICSSKMPVCTFFVHGRCSNDSCPYRHVNVNPKADFCIDFANGYCASGEKCKKWHVTVCAEYERNGQCERGEKCPLTHRKKSQKKDKSIASCHKPTVRPFLDRLSDETSSNTNCLPSFISLSPFEGPFPNNNNKRDENTSLDERLQIKPGFMTKMNR